MISINETVDLIPDIVAQTDAFSSNHWASWYFVCAHTINGGRFYSEPFSVIDDAYNCYKDFKVLVHYFGGGSIELLRITDQDYDVISIYRI